MSSVKGRVYNEDRQGTSRSKGSENVAGRDILLFILPLLRLLSRHTAFGASGAV
jgi:hypothetical protein